MAVDAISDFLSQYVEMLYGSTTVQIEIVWGTNCCDCDSIYLILIFLTLHCFKSFRSWVLQLQ